jgi:hypothetical protein
VAKVSQEEMTGISFKPNCFQMSLHPRISRMKSASNSPCLHMEKKQLFSPIAVDAYTGVAMLKEAIC